MLSMIEVLNPWVGYVEDHRLLRLGFVFLTPRFRKWATFALAESIR